MRFRVLFLAFITASLFISTMSQAALLPSRTILQKTVENAGSGTYAIEQEVRFSSGIESISLKENWLIENDRTMRLTVTGSKDLSSPVRMQFVYSGGQRAEILGTNRQARKISEDFFEKYLNFRSTEQFANSMVRLKIVPSNFLAKKNYEKTGSDFKYIPESHLRYSRAGGAITYAFGEPSPAEGESSNPGVWIEQDQFVVRKVRLPSQAEMTADNFSQFAKGLNYPRQRTIRWDNNVVTIRLIGASARPTNSSAFQASALDVPTKLEGLNGLKSKDAILEFYSRFR